VRYRFTGKLNKLLTKYDESVDVFSFSTFKIIYTNDAGDTVKESCSLTPTADPHTIATPHCYLSHKSSG
jgi:hypothetical protein